MKTFKYHGTEYVEIAQNLYGLASEHRMPAGKRHHFMRAVSLIATGEARYRMFPVPQGGSLQSWQETLVSAQIDGTAVTNTLTATTILPPAARYTLPANYFAVGKVLRIKLACRTSNVVTTPGTLTLDVRMGPTSNIIVFNGGAMQMSTTVHTTLPLYAEILLTCRAIGSGTSANLMGQGLASGQSLSLTAVADSTTTVATLPFPNTAPAVGTGFDSTVSMVVDVFATFSVNTATTQIQLHQYTLESLN